ncbi:MAG TPA: GMC oxidoreductase, partial [Myxococcota bacterium]|nr:GMC oxidoreductase [Myxococcota bacterium]
AHPFGGACRGATTDGVGRARPGLWVLDASAFPEALGVNPQVTIAALALEGAERILAG